MVQMNKSGIVPRGHRVLVLPDGIEDKTKSGVIVHSLSEKERKELAQIFGTVIALGDTVWQNKAAFGEDRIEPWAKVGDRIIYAKYAGLTTKGLDGLMYRLINDFDVVATCDPLLGLEYGGEGRNPLALAEAS